MRSRLERMGEPVGDPFRGAPYGERLDPSTVGMDVPQGQGMPAGMQAAGSALKLIAGLSAGNAARDAGAAQQAEANFEAAQLRQNAGQVTAASQRTAADSNRNAALVASRAIAVAAAGGGSVTDPSTLKIIADINGEGAYRSSMALYNGEAKAREFEMAADAKVYSGNMAAAGGKQKQTAYTMSGLSGLGTGAASLYSKYGRGGPKTNAIDKPAYGYNAESDTSGDG